MHQEKELCSPLTDGAGGDEDEAEPRHCSPSDFPVPQSSPVPVIAADTGVISTQAGHLSCPDI